MIKNEVYKLEHLDQIMAQQTEELRLERVKSTNLQAQIVEVRILSFLWKDVQDPTPGPPQNRISSANRIYPPFAPTSVFTDDGS